MSGFLRHTKIVFAIAATLGAGVALQAADGAPSGGATLLPYILVPGASPVQGRTAADTYTVTAGQIGTTGEGADSAFTRVLLQTPGVSQDSAGQVHFREEDPYYQYYLNGVWLPAGINGFGQDIDTRYVESVSTLVGALPAQYAWGSYGVIDIQTKNPAEASGGATSLYSGSNRTLHPSLTDAQSWGRTSAYLTASYLHDDLGIENPTPGHFPLHDTTHQYRAFGQVSRQLTDDSRISLMADVSYANYQIPDNPGQASMEEFRGRAQLFPVANSALLAERQDERTQFVVASYQATAGNIDWQVSASSRHSAVLARPDIFGDLYFNGVASRVARGIFANALQADATGHWGAHTVSAGLKLDTEDGRQDDREVVFAATAANIDPATGLTEILGAPFLLADDHAKLGYDSSAYLQDEWRLSRQLTLNLGTRFDWTDAYVNESQLSPRLVATYRAADGTTFHAGYARYFIPPPLENVSPSSVSLYDGTTNAAQIQTDDPVKCERSDYFDAGVVQSFAAGWKASLDAYYKRATDQIDDGQFGVANIYSPYNFARARIYGTELTLSYSRGGFAAYGNLSVAQAWARGIVSSQFEFEPDELAYISSHDIHPDQTQFVTASAGVSYSWAQTSVHADAIYGSGIRRGFANQDSLPANYPVNIGVARRFGRLSLRLDVLNVFDQVYELNDGTGIGVGAPKYGNRREIFAGISRRF